MQSDGRKRAVIEGVSPEIDAGRFPIKRVIGESVTVEADIFTDGHDAVSAVLRYCREGGVWYEMSFAPLTNDRWRATFPVPRDGRWRYTLIAWVDAWKTWRRDFVKRVDAAQDVRVDLRIGAELVAAAAERANDTDAAALRSWADALVAGHADTGSGAEVALDTALNEAMERNPNRSLATLYERELGVIVDRQRARFSTWYEFFPRSTGPDEETHGTFRTAAARLPEIAAMGFDVVYLPPIHPIGTTFRKGRNNAVTASPGDTGSPWAIGSAEGGHTAIHPELGTLDDFRALLVVARQNGVEIALDFAVNCTPDHPWVKEHPDWFRQRPDGTIQYAENPPKKYQDIYPINFECADWGNLWAELHRTLCYWCEQGVRIFRVDNPHTKAFAFWEWCIAEIKREFPDVLLLAEAFTRPKVLYRLAKLGFTQGYTYFAWRTAKAELETYLTQLTKGDVREYFRPNFWPNTPDILTEQFHTGGRPVFASRLVLAATLTASYGIYGPAYELLAAAPREAGSEEYRDSEKYQLVSWATHPDAHPEENIRALITRVNRARHDHAALQTNEFLVFHPTDNEHLIAYSKRDARGRDTVLMVVNLDPKRVQSGWVDVQLDALDIEGDVPYQCHDLLTDARYRWQGGRNYVSLDPESLPAHLFHIRRFQRTEKDFDYFV